MFEILHSYTFWVVTMGTFILATVAGAVGCITVLKGQSLIGDAIGHSTFPGIVLAFMLFLLRDPWILLLGAMFTGAVAFILIQVFHDHSKVELDAVLAIVLSTFFGLGMVLKSYIQGNPDFAGASQSGLQNYIFGQAAYMMKSDVQLILAVSIPSIILLVLFYKEIKVFVFDETFSKTIGIPSTLLYAIILVMSMSLIATGLKAVGAILISSFFIAPALTALQWSDQLNRVMIIAAITGGISSVLGTYFSTLYRGLSTGPTIIVFMTIFASFSLVFGPRGMLKQRKMRRRYRDYE